VEIPEHREVSVYTRRFQGDEEQAAEVVRGARVNRTGPDNHWMLAGRSLEDVSRT